MRSGSGWRPWESPSLLDLDLSRPPLRSGYSMGKMLFDTRTLEASDEKDLSTVTRKVEEYSTSLTSRVLYCDEAQSGSPGLTWLEVTPKVAQICVNVGPLLPVRLLITPVSCKPVIRTVHTLFVHSCDDKAFVDVIEQLLPSSPYTTCPGISDYAQRYKVIHRDVQGLRKISVGASELRYDSDRCLKWHIPANKKSFT